MMWGVSETCLGACGRQAVELRSRLQREIAAKEKESKERELRDIAMRARMDRAGGAAPAPAAARMAGTAAGLHLVSFSLP